MSSETIAAVEADRQRATLGRKVDQCGLLSSWLLHTLQCVLPSGTLRSSLLLCRPAPVELGMDRVRHPPGQLHNIKYGGLPALIAQMDGVQSKVDGMLTAQRGANEAVNCPESVFC